MQHEREETFSHLLTLIGVPAVIFDISHHTLHSANEAFCDLVGYSERELKTLRCQDFVAENEKQRAAQVMRSPAPIDPQKWMVRRKDGSVITLVVAYRFMDMVLRDAQIVRATMNVIVAHGEKAEAAAG